MTQQTFEPSVSSTLGTARSIFNDNATDAEVRLSELATPSVLSKSGSYTILPGDAGKTITSTSSSALSFTLTDSISFATGATIEIVQEAEGTLTLAEGAGTTINRSRFATLELGGRYSTVRLRKQSAGTWIASGDLKEESPGAIVTIVNQPITGSAQPLPFESLANQGSLSAFSYSGSTLTCQIGGLYSLAFTLLIKDSRTNGSLDAGFVVRVNGSVIFRLTGLREVTNASIFIDVDNSGFLRLSKNDVVEVATRSSGTTSFSGAAEYRQIYLQRIGD